MEGLKMSEASKQPEAKQEPVKQPEAKVEKKEERTTYSPTSQPDGKPTPGKVVKDGDLVKSTVGAILVDNLTTVAYDPYTWTEAKASAWLDGQLRAGKILVK